VAGIAELARGKGAMILVDGYQALGSMQFDVKKVGIDFLVGGNLKYLLGTAGIGFLYVRRPLVEALEPTVTGWFAQENIGAMDHTRHRPAPNARRFETGTPPVPNTYAAEAGIRILSDVGMANVEARIGTLVDSVIERARAVGYRLVTPLEPERHGPMVNIVSTDAERLVAELEERGVVTSCRDNALRVSLHFYNDDRDIDHLFTELERLSKLIRRA
jgi:selenocysteine lyase/cysteine desulfurase